MMKVWQSQGLSTQISLKCSTDSMLELLIPYLYACLSISILSAKHYQATIFPHSNTKPSEMSRSKNSTSHMDKSPGVFWFQLPSLHAWLVRSLGRKDPLEEEMATHSSILAWEISWTEEPGGPQSMGLQESGRTCSCLCSQGISVP